MGGNSGYIPQVDIKTSCGLLECVFERVSGWEFGLA